MNTQAKKSKKTRRRKREKKFKQALTAEQAERAIYIDFEGTKGWLPTFMGVLCIERGQETFCQTVFEQLFNCTLAQDGSVLSSMALEDLVPRLTRQAVQEDRYIVAWSRHEVDAIREFSGLDGKDLAAFEKRYRNVIEMCESWAEAQCGVKPEVNKLERYFELTEYEVPDFLAKGQAGDWLRDVRASLKRMDGEYQRCGPTVKQKWQNLLEYNYHDCAGLRHVTRTAAG